MAHSMTLDTPEEIQRAILDLAKSIHRERRRKLKRILFGLAVIGFVALAVGSLEYPVDVLAEPGPNLR
jgi:hypothetical protein